MFIELSETSILTNMEEKGIAHKTLKAQLKEIIKNYIISLYSLTTLVVLHRRKWEHGKATSPTPGS